MAAVSVPRPVSSVFSEINGESGLPTCFTDSVDGSETVLIPAATSAPALASSMENIQ